MPFTSLANPGRARRTNTLAMIKGMDAFVERFRGVPNPGRDAGILVNEDYVVGNSLHVERGRGNYLPTNAATSESQVILAQAYLDAYRAVGDQDYLDKAITYAEAYLKHYFIAYRLPARRGPFRAHWVINGKLDFTSWGPIDYRDYQNSGAFDAVVTVANGRGRVPHGVSWRGEWTRRVYMAREKGSILRWRNVFAEAVNWTGPTPKSWDIEWFMDKDGTVFTGENARMETPPAEAAGAIPGDFALFDRTVNEDVELTFATETGHRIERNQGFDAWPMWRALNFGESASALDAELWHTELFRDLFQETNDTKWLRAWNSAVYSLNEATVVEAENVYFARDDTSTYPFTKGIAYGFGVGPNSRSSVSRDGAGYIYIQKDQELFFEDTSWVSIEQIGLLQRINEGSRINVQWATSQTEGHMDLLIGVASSVAGSQRFYRTSRLFHGYFDTPPTTEFNPRDLVANERADGTVYKHQVGSRVTGFRDFRKETLQGTVLDRFDLFTRIYLEGGIAGGICGFWVGEPKELPLPLEITYRTVAGERVWARVKDANGWLWWRELPDTTGWQSITLRWSDLVASEYQENSGTPPSSPTPAPVQQVVFVPPYSPPLDYRAVFDVYCVGERPPKLGAGEFFVRHLYLRFYDWREYVVRVGDVYTKNPLPLKFKYAPGVVPFTYDFDKFKGGKRFWRGSPYVGYQYPSVWAENGQLDKAAQVVDFYKAAQDDYEAKIGVRGPWTPVFYWPKWDNLDYGTAETFGFNGPDPNAFWGGFQARTFHSAAHLWWVLVDQGDPVPAALPGIVEDYARFLADFLAANNGQPPTEFYAGQPPVTTYQEPHMVGLSLAAAIYALKAGSTEPKIQEVVDRTIGTLNALYVTTGEMRGSFSTDTENRTFYGFWVAEIMRALALYYTYDFENFGEPAARTSIPGVEIALEDGSGLLLAENGNPLAFDRAAPAIQALLTLENGDPLLKEDGSFLLLE